MKASSLGTVLQMKVSIIFVSFTTADSILPVTTCQTLNGDFGVSLKCSYDAGYVVGFCSSGNNRDCNNGHDSHQYKCCNEHEVSIDVNKCETQHGHKGYENISFLILQYLSK